MDGIKFSYKAFLFIGFLAFPSGACDAQVRCEGSGKRQNFEVAAITPDDPNGTGPATNLDLDATDYFRYQGGPVVADGYLINYLIFAYQLPDSGEYASINAEFPAWAQIHSSHRFRLEARADGPVTKETLRCMVRSLLAERFGLQVHTEVRPQLAWVLLWIKNAPDKTSQLRLHTSDPVCTTVSPVPTSPAKRQPGIPRPYCGLLLTNEEESVHLRIQDFTLRQIAGELGMLAIRRARMQELPVVDGTQLQGRYDLDLRYGRARTLNSPDEPTASDEPDLLQALSTQAKLEFRKKIVPVELLIVDHVNELTPN